MARQIRKAVLLAAGRGRRLGDLTAHTPKPLLEIAGKPVIEHIVEALADCEIREIAIVTGYLAEQIEARRAEMARAHPATRIATIRQRDLNGTGGALLAAKDFIAGEDAFLFGWGDIVMDRGNYARFVHSARSAHYDLLLAINRTRDPWRGAAVYVRPDMRVKKIIEKPPPGTSATNWNNAGLFAATPLLFDYVAKLRPSARGELELPEAIAMMIEDGAEARAVDVHGFWSDIGTPEDLELARKRFRPGAET